MSAIEHKHLSRFQRVAVALAVAAALLGGWTLGASTWFGALLGAENPPTHSVPLSPKEFAREVERVFRGD